MTIRAQIQVANPYRTVEECDHELQRLTTDLRTCTPTRRRHVLRLCDIWIDARLQAQEAARHR